MVCTNANLILMLILAPLPFSLAVLLLRRSEILKEPLTIIGSFIPLAISVPILQRVMDEGYISAFGNELLIDHLSAIFLLGISFVGFFASIFAHRYMRQHPLIARVGVEIAERRLGIFYSLFLFFLSTMLWSVSTNNIIILWVAIEATTIASALLVSFYWDRRALEAGYKYLLLLTVGVTFSLFGAVIIYAASAPYIAHGSPLLFTNIKEVISKIPASIILLSAVLFTVGFGTKAGLAPFHPWLPDAHAEAPTPISVLLSGIMVEVGLYALLRTLGLFLPAYPAVASTLLVLAVFSMLLGALLAMVQSDLKRLLAYSSVSQIGYIAMGLGVGTYLGYYGAFYQLISHILAKSLLFMCVGAIIYSLALRNIEELGGVGKHMPITMACFFIGAFSLSGIPPLAGFLSKLTLIIATAQVHLWWLLILTLLTSLLTLFYAVRAAYTVFWGEEKSEVIKEAKEAPMSILFPILVFSILTFVLGVYPQILYPLLNSASLLAPFK
ncbi:oxidoreductase [bacterium]|nr:oxidoreductase [bacterium]